MYIKEMPSPSPFNISPAVLYDSVEDDSAGAGAKGIEGLCIKSGFHIL